MCELPESQRKALTALYVYWKQHRCSPSLQDIADLCGWKSRMAASLAIRPLIAKGFIEKVGRTRGYVLTDPGLQALKEWKQHGRAVLERDQDPVQA